jgi:hypothetical protein
MREKQFMYLRDLSFLNNRNVSVNLPQALLLQVGLDQWFSNVSGLRTPEQYFTHSRTPYPSNYGNYGNFKMNGTIYAGFGNKWCRNHLASPSNSEVPVCERSCHMQRKIEIKPCTAINNMDLRQINIFCEIFKIFYVVFFLCSLYISFHMLFHWKKTKQLNNRADPLAQPRGTPSGLQTTI